MTDWLRIDKKRQVYHRKYTAAIERSLKAQIAPILDQISRGIPIDTINTSLSGDPLKMSFGKLYTDTGTAFAKGVLRDMTGKARKDDLTDIWEREMLEFMSSQAGARIISITGTSGEIAKRILRELAASRIIPEGLSIERTSRILHREFTRAYVKTTLARARVIAQTEVLTASNRGSRMGAVEAGAAQKIWLTSGIVSPDGKPRHVGYPGLHGQIRGFNEKYDVRGFPADHPGDIKLPSSESVNCKCAEIYK